VRHRATTAQPATYAAAISPCEWPITASGLTPTTSTVRPATPSPQRAPLHHVTHSMPGAPGVPRRTSFNDQSTNSVKASAHASICWRIPARYQVIRYPCPAIGALAGENEHGLACGRRRAPDTEPLSSSPPMQLARPATGPDHANDDADARHRSTGPPATYPTSATSTVWMRAHMLSQPGS